jgi:hypothetical protein
MVGGDAGLTQPSCLFSGGKEGASFTVLDVDPDRARLQHGGHGSGEVLVPGLDISGYRHIDGRYDTRDDRRHPLRAESSTVGHTEGPGHPGAGRGDCFRSGGGDRDRGRHVPCVRQEEWLPWPMQPGEELRPLCLPVLEQHG